MKATWIKVIDRMPDNNKVYFLSHSKGKCYGWHDEGWFIKGKPISENITVNKWLEVKGVN